MKPGKHSDTRIKPFPSANGHGRYTTVTPERALVSVVTYNRYKFVTVSLPRRFRNGHFASKTVEPLLSPKPPPPPPPLPGTAVLRSNCCVVALTINLTPIPPQIPFRLPHPHFSCFPSVVLAWHSARVVRCT
jgi:hypothetical protein